MMKDERCPSDILRETMSLMGSGLNVLVKMISMSVCVLLRLSFVGSEIDGKGDWNTQCQRIQMRGHFWKVYIEVSYNMYVFVFS